VQEAEVDERTLYERVGGARAVEEMVGDFYRRVLADPPLRPFFEGVEMQKLRLMQREFFSAALGGPVTYTGVPLTYAHHGRGIRREHFARFVEHLLATLRTRGVGEAEALAIIGRINTYADEVVGGYGVSE
jgi:hemoglobin